MSQECEILCERIIKSSEVITPMNLIRATLIDFNSAPSVLGWEERNKKIGEFRNYFKLQMGTMFQSRYVK